MYNLNLMLNIPLYKYKTETVVAGWDSGCSLTISNAGDIYVIAAN